MSELGEAERALLALASDAHDPTETDRARVRAALAARLGAAAGLGVGAALGAAASAKAATAGATGVATTAKVAAAGAAGLGSTATGAAAVTGGALAAKLVVAVALTAAVGVGATVKLVHRGARVKASVAETELHAGRAPTGPPPAPTSPRLRREAPPAEAPVVAAPAPAAQRSLHAPSPAPAPTAIAGAPAAPESVPSRDRGIGAVPAPAPVAPPAPLAGPDVPPQPAPATRPVPVTTTSDHHPAAAKPSRAQACGPGHADLDGPRPQFTVADETRLVHDGVRALHEGQPACALSLLDTHARFYPHGVLAEEREAERALALAELGRLAEARAVGAAFLHAHPGSPLGARLRQRIPGIDPVNHDMTGRATRP